MPQAIIEGEISLVAIECRQGSDGHAGTRAASAGVRGRSVGDTGRAGVAAGQWPDAVMVQKLARAVQWIIVQPG